MKIDRYAVNLFLEIKRSLPEELGHPLKIANPNLVQEMGEIYHAVEDESIKYLIEVLLMRIDPDRSKSLLKKRFGSKYRKIKSNRLWNRDAKPDEKSAKTAKKTATQRYYRGVLVED